MVQHRDSVPSLNCTAISTDSPHMHRDGAGKLILPLAPLNKLPSGQIEDQNKLPKIVFCDHTWHSYVDGGRFFPEEDLQARLMEEQREAAAAAAAASAAQHQSDLLTVATASGSSATSSRKRKRTAVGEDNKDDRYWERRRKNNMAAKRSRDARRAKENQIAMRATFLERENRVLTQELGKARAENHLLRERLCKYEVL